MSPTYLVPEETLRHERGLTEGVRCLWKSREDDHGRKTMDYWTAVEAAIYWCHHGHNCAYVVERPSGFDVIWGDDSPALYQPEVRVCLRVGAS